MEIKILNLKLRNFKGVKELEILIAKILIYMEQMQQEKQQYLMHLNGYFLIKIAMIEKTSI